MGRVCSTNRANWNARRILVGTPKRKWVNNIKMDLREIGWGDMDWMDLAQERD
jgi:hypothetical protein